jgi:hypothetical protein
VISSATAIEQDPSLADNQVQTQLIVSGTAQSSSAAPFGAVDLPGEGAVVSGSIAVGGWALDDGGVRHVRIYRDSVAPEPPGLVYIGEAVRVRGARPDVERLFAGVPEADSAGWGLLVLTNLLPNRGTGTYRLHAYAEDDRGQQKLLGSRTIVGVNATATTPFGAIDTPGQGETIHGTAYPIFGWALTPPPAVIAADGSTISVYIDGQAVGGVTYNNYRADVAALFPEYLNAAGAVGYRLLDTTTLGAGLHTVAWSVTDSTGATVGLGSRFFRVQQAAAAVPATARVAAVGERARDVPRQVIAGEMERIEIDATALMPGACTVARYEGQERVGPASRPLPIGSRLDAASGIFTWQPGPGFVGRYRLVFVRQGCDAIPVETPVDVIVRKRDVR